MKFNNLSSDEAEKWYIDHRQYYDKLKNAVHSLVEVLVEKAALVPFIIKSRTKEVTSFVKNVDDHPGKYLEQTFDLAGVRVVVYSTSARKKAVNIVKGHFEVERCGEYRDKRDPYKFGYDAYHCICNLGKIRLGLPEYSEFDSMRFEIQVMTVLEHAWAEFGHDIFYKPAIEIGDHEINHLFARARGDLENAQEKFDKVLARINELKQGVSDYDESTSAKVKSGDITNMQLDNITLNSFLREHLIDSHPNLRFSGAERASKAIERLTKFGITDIGSLKANIPSADILAKYETRETLSILHMILILIDADRFARLFWYPEWRITPKFRKFLRQDKIDTQKFPESKRITSDNWKPGMFPCTESTEITELGLRNIVIEQYSTTKAKLCKDSSSLADVIEEMRRMRILNLGEIRRIIEEVNGSTSKTISDTNFQSIADLIRYTLIIWDDKLYFTVGWRYDWNPHAKLKQTLPQLNKEGVDIRSIPSDDPT